MATAWYIEFLVIVVLFLFCCISAGVCFFKFTKRDFDTTESADHIFWAKTLGSSGLLLVVLVWFYVFEDRWDCPKCEQVNIYYDVWSKYIDKNASDDTVQQCSRCNITLVNPQKYNDGKPFYSLP